MAAAILHSRPVFPTYPHGYVVVAGHVPWSVPNVIALVALVSAFAAARRVLIALAVPAGRAFGVALHGRAWLAPGGGGASVDWSRFGAEAYYGSVHAVLCAYACASPDLRAELLSWASDAAPMWAVHQPAMSAALRTYLVAQIAYNAESTLAILTAFFRGPSTAGRDRAMLLHHAAAILLCALCWRTHFVRVGVFVSLLHDVTDLPIDGIRLAQALGWDSALYVAVAAALLGWPAGRLVCYPLKVIYPAITDSQPIFDHSLRTLDPRIATISHAMFIVPLVLLWLLHCYWYMLLLKKVSRHVRRAKVD
ncbi:hypothetical protein KFE25_011412 [Diacronema lutheri]|uniref:TLC domain-containing protein n=1 Tax=Diacronema lutheri TaxID=2081491 RepID=A0A8J5XGQ6_DIALT|nr:hypothetical protein KFE25_011412 [Diacronema lutheri]